MRFRRYGLHMIDDKGGIYEIRGYFFPNRVFLCRLSGWSSHCLHLVGKHAFHSPICLDTAQTARIVVNRWSAGSTHRSRMERSPVPKASSFSLQSKHAEFDCRAYVLCIQARGRIHQSTRKPELPLSENPTTRFAAAAAAEAVATSYGLDHSFAPRTGNSG